MNMSNQRVDRWSVAHSYKRLCDAGLAEPLTSRDGEVYILKADADYTPCYWLPSSDSYMRPGADFWIRLRDAVDKVELDSLDGPVLK